MIPKTNFDRYLESNFAPGAYTAVVAGSGGATGVGIVEIYRLSD